MTEEGDSIDYRLLMIDYLVEIAAVALPLRGKLLRNDEVEAGGENSQQRTRKVEGGRGGQGFSIDEQLLIIDRNSEGSPKVGGVRGGKSGIFGSWLTGALEEVTRTGQGKEMSSSNLAIGREG